MMTFKRWIFFVTCSMLIVLFYAVGASADDTVWMNGRDGIDTNDGAIDSPVQTIERAFELGVADGDTWLVWGGMNDATIDDTPTVFELIQILQAKSGYHNADSMGVVVDGHGELILKKTIGPDTGAFRIIKDYEWQIFENMNGPQERNVDIIESVQFTF